MADAETRASQEAEALKARLADQEKRVTSLEAAGHELERALSDARLKLAEAPKPEEVTDWQTRLKDLEALSLQASSLQALKAKLEAEQVELKRQRRESAAFAKERQTIRRKVEELLSTLESVRLG